MNRVFADLDGSCCLYCAGQRMADEVAKAELRHPLGWLTGSVRIMPLPLCWLEAQPVMVGFYDRMEEIKAKRNYN